MSIAQYLLDKWQGNAVGLKEEYKSRLEHGAWVVEFTKVDGTPAVMECTLDPKLLPTVNSISSTDKVERPEREDLLHVYSLDRAGWRSFKVANVSRIYQKPESL